MKLRQTPREFDRFTALAVSSAPVIPSSAVLIRFL